MGRSINLCNYLLGIEIYPAIMEQNISKEEKGIILTKTLRTLLGFLSIQGYSWDKRVSEYKVKNKVYSWFYLLRTVLQLRIEEIDVLRRVLGVIVKRRDSLQMEKGVHLPVLQTTLLEAFYTWGIGSLRLW